VARPLTHDLLRSVIDALGARINSVIVNDLANDTFYARVLLDVDGRSVEIDSRPSDAIALAVRAEVPIFAEESVLDKAGVVLDGEKALDKATVDPEELERMSAFREFIETLDLDDFEKRKPPSSA
jgi:bifunctional DNase/RNase